MVAKRRVKKTIGKGANAQMKMMMGKGFFDSINPLKLGKKLLKTAISTAGKVNKFQKQFTGQDASKLAGSLPIPQAQLLSKGLAMTGNGKRMVGCGRKRTLGV